MISRRITQLSPFSLATLLALAPDESVIDLALGVPPGPPPEPLVTSAVAALRKGHHQYIEADGLPELRAGIAERLWREHRFPADPNREITITCGATEGLYAALLAVTDVGDEVILLQPFFENHRGAVELAGAVPRVVALNEPDWTVDPAAVRAAVNERTRAIVLSNPNNPTGRVFTEAELTELLDICRERNLVCIADEVYRQYTYEHPHTSLLDIENAREHLVVLRSFSKALQVSGWRIGFGVAVPELSAALRKAHVRTTLGSATPLQHALLAAGLHSDEGGAEFFRRRRGQLVAGLGRLGFQVTAPEGGWFVLAGVRPLGWRSGDLAARLAAEAGVLVAPAAGFFADPAEGESWVRFSMARDEAATTEALDRIGRFLATHSPRP